MRILTCKKKFFSKKIKVLSLCLILVGSILSLQNKAFAGSLPGSMTVSVKSIYNVGEDITISWTASTNATKYGLSVWKPPYSNDSYLVWDNYVTGTSKNIGTLPAGSYRVNMKPYNSSGGGPISNIIDFTVKDPVATPTQTKTPTPNSTPAKTSTLTPAKKSVVTTVIDSVASVVNSVGTAVNNFVSGIFNIFSSKPASKPPTKTSTPEKTTIPAVVSNDSNSGYPWNASNCPMASEVQRDNRYKEFPDIFPGMAGYYSTGGATYPEGPQNTWGQDGHGYGCRQCASYVAWRINKETGEYPSWGDAKDFAKRARADGFGKGDDGKPHAGSIAVFTKNANGNPFGHVAWVESEPYKNAKGQEVIRVSEYNDSRCGNGYGNFCQNVELPVAEFDDFVLIKSNPEIVNNLEEDDPITEKTVTFKTRTVSQKFKNKSGVTIDVDLDLPQLEGIYDGIATINAYYDKREKELIDMKEEDYLNSDSPGGDDFYIKADFHQETILNDIISISGNGDSFAGGVTNPEIYGDVFDLNTGKKLTLDDVFNVSSDKYLTLVYDYVTENIKEEMANEKPGNSKYSLNDDALSSYPGTVKSVRAKKAISDFDPRDFFLTDKSLIVFYPKYSLGAGASGTFKYEIPFDSITDVLKIKVQTRANQKY
mgnify:CR=1 FL=1